MSRPEFTESLCGNCKEEIYFGPRKAPKKKTEQRLDDSWTVEVWRHKKTGNAQCEPTYAQPFE